MKTEGLSGKLALALSGLAVVLAAGGTAVAVTSSTSIEDPDIAGRYARVDVAGRLNTVNATSRLHYSQIQYAPNARYWFLTTPTNAHLAVTNVSVSAGSLGSTAADGTSYRVYLYQAVVPTSATTCTQANSSSYVQLRGFVVGPNKGVEADYAAPLLVRPATNTKYCLMMYTEVAGGPNGSSNVVVPSLSAFVAAGVYAGPGSKVVPSSQRKPGTQR
ncbi:hypothetical protein [Nocardioides stalactiti]|uniref:hypothetical protein n=1 Tax=Nocardioides stalactiti TaxID=2755356 RepID=UPI0015FF345B|nr:hypothetical protein [Nocardioides stalactiti]